MDSEDETILSAGGQADQIAFTPAGSLKGGGEAGREMKPTNALRCIRVVPGILACSGDLQHRPPVHFLVP